MRKYAIEIIALMIIGWTGFLIMNPHPTDILGWLVIVFTSICLFFSGILWGLSTAEI